ncbi:MAG TPA: DUF2339 domain-containing protein [Gemmatimonadaceae bacterium]
MTEDERPTVEQRLTRLEEQVAAIITRLDAGPRPGHTSASRRIAPAVRKSYQNPFSARSIEWWLARGGAVLTCLALLLLYQYAVERNWITPVVRVAAGIVVGLILFLAATRVRRESPRSDDAIGLREVLLGAGLASWYITSYAAAIYYALIPAGTARLLFLILSIAGAWIALREHRSVLGFLALAIGYLTPMILPSRDPYIPAAAVYLAALTSVGLLLYLMRGWQSILWLTFAGFWWTASRITDLICCGAPGIARITGSISSARIAMSIVIIAAGAAMLRTPLLRRRLVATGSSLYTEPNPSERWSSMQASMAARMEKFSGINARRDSPALWVISIFGPLLSVLFLSWIWTGVQGTAWGILSLVSAAAAHRMAAASNGDDEFTHVEAAAATIWSLAGVLWLANSIGSALGASTEFTLAAASLHSLLIMVYFSRSRFTAPLRIAIATSAACIVVVLFSETMFRNFALSGFDAGWTIAELTVIAVCLTIWWTQRAPADPLSVATLFGVAAYLSLMLIDARILNRVWAPLITASFAIAGAALLMLGHGHREAQTLRRLGGFTLVVVVARLFMFDLARVETIWRVMLFLGCGALFLFTSHRLNERSDSSRTIS